MAICTALHAGQMIFVTVQLSILEHRIHNRIMMSSHRINDMAPFCDNIWTFWSDTWARNVLKQRSSKKHVYCNCWTQRQPWSPQQGKERNQVVPRIKKTLCSQWWEWYWPSDRTENTLHEYHMMHSPRKIHLLEKLPMRLTNNITIPDSKRVPPYRQHAYRIQCRNDAHSPKHHGVNNTWQRNVWWCSHRSKTSNNGNVQFV